MEILKLIKPNYFQMDIKQDLKHGGGGRGQYRNQLVPLCGYLSV